MLYTARIWAIGSFPEIKIEQEQFAKLKLARVCLSGALAIEEKYEILISNYLELEKECLNITSNLIIRNTIGYESFFDITLSLNRRVVNLLSSTKLYIDQIKHHVKACIPDDEELSHKVESLFSNEYDATFEYRFMEALRNYVQHRGLAVHSPKVGGKWTSLEEDRQYEFKTSIFTLKSEVENDKAFKKKILNEMPEKVDLLYSVRTYIGSISKVHGDIRKLLSNTVEESRNLIASIIKEYEDINSGNSTGLTAVCSLPMKPISKTIETFPLLLKWDDIRVSLINKNRTLINLPKTYVSSNTDKKES